MLTGSFTFAYPESQNKNGRIIPFELEAAKKPDELRVIVLLVNLIINGLEHQFMVFIISMHTIFLY